MSVEDMEKYYEDDKFLYLVVEVADLIFGFDIQSAGINFWMIMLRIKISPGEGGGGGG